MELMLKLIREEEGQSMVEYGLIVAVVALVCVGTYKTLGEKINDLVAKMTGKIDAIGNNVAP